MITLTSDQAFFGGGAGGGGGGKSKKFFKCVITMHQQILFKYRKIPKISPGVYIFERPFLRVLVLEGLIFGGAYLRREICVSKSIALAL